jgi:multiple sugar transport system substrate-binding protein
MDSILLQGKTWGHSRGYTPLVAIAQRFQELNPAVNINWTKRTLQEFADFPIEKLTETNDLIIIDHPWVGCADATKCVVNFNDYLPASYLQNQLEHSVGNSYQSYNYNGNQWALAIDAATPVASYRKDLLETNNCSIPQHWNELIELTKAGKVAAPAIPIDLLMNFYTFCIACGETPFLNTNEIVSKEIGLEAIALMKSFYSLLDKNMFTCNPIAVAELMSTTNDYWYCPFAYGYSNYSRIGFANNLLHYTNVVKYNGVDLKTTIGGTGIAVSAKSKYIDIAVKYAAMLCSQNIQQTMYVQHGGQPAHKAAWLNETANSITNNFFKNTLHTLSNSYMRPRYNGYLHFQDEAGLPLQQCLLNNANAFDTLIEMNKIYLQSLIHHNQIVTV